MPLPTGDVIGILGDNLRLRKSVLPLPTKVATKWTEGLGLPRGGETVLYTGMMYQLIPYIEGLVKAEIKFGDSWLGKYTGLGPPGEPLRSTSRRSWRDPRRRSAPSTTRCRSTSSTCCARPASSSAPSTRTTSTRAPSPTTSASMRWWSSTRRRSIAVFKKRGVKTVITIDPHTTTMLRSVYPKILSGYDIEVKSYLEVLAEKGFGSNGNSAKALSGEVVMHDSCVFARYEGVVDEPRELLAAAGLTVRDPENAGRQTWCCGGPVESLYPAKAIANAEKRVAQLREAAPDAVTMCPMCFVNLSNAAGDTMRFKDISQYLREAYAS